MRASHRAAFHILRKDAWPRDLHQLGALLFFIDDSWQTIDGHSVGAVGGVVIAADLYNDCCNAFYGIKKDVLGARELTDSEIKGGSAGRGTPRSGWRPTKQASRSRSRFCKRPVRNGAVPEVRDGDRRRRR
jgi:hypothetical protein